MKILSFAASNSRHSINRQLLDFAERFLDDFEIERLDIHNYEMPIYSIDREQESGIPAQAGEFLDKVSNADGLLVAFAEHNGNYTVAFKNLLDWCTRADRHVYRNKKILMLSTSPGQGGGKRVLDIAETTAPYYSGTVVASLAIPQFHDYFDVKTGTLINEEYGEALAGVIALFVASLEK